MGDSLKIIGDIKHKNNSTESLISSNEGLAAHDHANLQINGHTLDDGCAAMKEPHINHDDGLPQQTADQGSTL